MITVITGPPCSGKTTYVQQHRLPGDLVIDFDALAMTFGGTASHDHPAWIREITAAAWAEAIRRAIQTHHGHRVWIIDARPRTDRLTSYRQARARIVHLHAEPAELHRRADGDGRPKIDHQRIDEWFAAGRQ